MQLLARLNPPHRFRQLKKIALSRTARNSSILLVGNGVGSALSIIALIVVSRTLGPEKFGVIVTFNAIWLTITTLTDFGLGTSAIKFIASHLSTDRHKAAVFMRVIFQLELLCGLLIGAIGLLFSQQIANLLGGSHLLLAVRLGFIAGLFVSIGAFINPFLTAYEQFTKLSIVIALGAVYRVGGILLLLMLAVLNINNVMLLYTSVPILIFILALIITPKDFTQPMRLEEQKEAFAEIFHFTKWIFLSTIAVVAFGRFDVFFLSHLKGSKEVGLYGAALQLNNFFPLIIGTISSVMLPWASKLQDHTELVKFVKKSTAGLSLLCIALIPIFFLSAPIIHLVFGNKFSGSIGAFRLIFPGYLVNLLTSGMVLIFFVLSKPKIVTLINFIQLVLLIIIDVILIPRIGLYGAATGFLITQAVASVLIMILVRRELKNMTVSISLS